MKVLKLLMPAAILAFTIFLTSCGLTGSRRGSEIKPADVLLRSDVARIFRPLRADEPLSYGLACQIIEHNVNYFCEFPETAPATFDMGLCNPAVPVCEAVLGKPRMPSPPPPQPSGI